LSIIDKVCGKIGITNPDDIPEPDIDEEAETKPEAEQHLSEQAGSDKVVDFQGVAREHAASCKMRVMVIDPKSFDDAQQVADCLKAKKPVIVNFENTDSEDAHRIVDFISGTTYALNGDLKKVGHNVFLCAPSNVNVDYTEDKKTVSTEMPWLKK
jgi:cell division inhibitor SepF